MLQFLQCKTFGNQAVPQGWIIVAAGNPPEYNKSVRDFDMVTLDRVRYLKIEADYRVWKSYAREQHIHNAILSYLELRPKNFYRVEADVDGIRFVTARGWEDLSNLMEVYEEMELPVDETVIHEFLHHDAVAEDVAAYFDLYRKYQDDYGIAEILSGKVKPEVYARIYAAAFDERLSVVNLLLDGLQSLFAESAREKYYTDQWYEFLKEYRKRLDAANNGTEAVECYENLVAEQQMTFEQGRTSGFFTKEESREKEKLLALWRQTDFTEVTDKEIPVVFDAARQGFERQRQCAQEAAKRTAQSLEYAFDFMEQAFETGEEMVVFVTELTLQSESALFLSEHTCERYMIYSEKLLAGSRRAELLSELKR
jgi:hypothetical protein